MVTLKVMTPILCWPTTSEMDIGASVSIFLKMGFAFAGGNFYKRDMHGLVHLW